MSAVSGLAYLVGQLGLLLLAAAVAGAVLGRYIWAAPRIRKLDRELYRLRRHGSAALPGEQGDGPGSVI
jgi:uncharacterized integral membrane protein